MAGSQGFEDFVNARGQALQRFGYLLTSDWALAEDLVQTALSRAYPRWSRIQGDAPDAYVRKVMVNTWSSWWRRRWRGELPAAFLPDVAAGDAYAAVDRRHAVASALAGLPRRQRLVLVLRYNEDLSERQVSEMLGISIGTVKSQTAKALATLRSSGALDGYRSSVAEGA
ncbi:MAG: SigE family RNA polymerase sigma factor [Nocardiopsaceae bacterium]|nr:SigE family RNA polymerase sigma factor [Nocardiopsaceae bacterium]